MDTQTLTAIIISACGVLLLGMAGLIKGMISWRLDRQDEEYKGLKADVKSIQKDVDAIKQEHAYNHRKSESNPFRTLADVRPGWE